MFVIAEAAAGVYNTNQLRAICDVSEEDSAFLKVTDEERLGFMIPAEKVPEIQEKLSHVGLSLRHYHQQNFASPKACLGDLCPFAKQDALGLALDLTPLFSEKLKQHKAFISFGINGCPTACVASATDDIHLVGTDHGYDIYLGGRSSKSTKTAELFQSDVSKEDIGDVILDCLTTYHSSKQEGESLGDVIERVGMNLFRKTPTMPSSASEEQSQEEDSLMSVQEDSLLTDPSSSPSPEEELGSQTTPESTHEELGAEPSSSASEEEEEEEELGAEPASSHQTEEMEEDSHNSPPEDDDDFEEYAGYEKNPIIMNYDEEPTPTDETQGTLEALKTGENSVSLKEKERVTIKVVEQVISVTLPNGLDFFIPCNSLKEGESIEMQLENDLFLIENLYGKIHIKFDGMEVSIPIQHHGK